MKKFLAFLIVTLMLTVVLASCNLLPPTTTTPAHKCEHVCEECGKCLDAECAEDACAEKCEGHHECEDACEICGKCTSECAEPECADKCEGHVPPHECEDACEECGKCTSECAEPECADKCPKHYTLTLGEATVKVDGGKAVGTLPEVPAVAGKTGKWVVDGTELTPETVYSWAEDKTAEAVYTAITYTVTFKADGEVVDTKTYTVDNATVEAPAVPTKAHYTGAWESYTLTTGDVEVNAVYTAVEYTVTFKADGTVVGTKTYTVENATVEAPAVPEKVHYTGAWAAYELNGGNVEVNAVYTAVEYKVTFTADGKLVATETYTVENKNIFAPTVPTKTGYTGVWADYELNGGNVEVKAVYTANIYELTLGESKLTVTYGQPVGTLPAVPMVEGKKDGKWMLAGSELTSDTVWNFVENKEAVAEYTDITYTVVFKDGDTVNTLTVKHGDKVTATTLVDEVKPGEYIYWAVNGEPYAFEESVKSDLVIEMIRKTFVAPYYDIEVGAGQLTMDLALLGDNAWFGEVASVRAHGIEATFTVDGSKVTISEEALLVGENVVVITNKVGVSYCFIAVKATMFIDEVGDFNNILLQQGTTPTEEEKAVYYVITKDIDLAGFTGLGGYNAGGSGIHKTFVGTLDGRNHKLSNFTAPDNKGLFFYIQGTVRNIEFVNATSTGRGGVLAQNILANSVVENITITGKIVTHTTLSTQQHSLFTGYIGLGVKLTNITVNCTAIEGDATNVVIFGNANANSAVKVILTNCKVVRPEALSSYKVFASAKADNFTGIVEEVFLRNIIVEGYFDVEAGKGSYDIDLSDSINENLLSSTLGTLNGKVLDIAESALRMGDNTIVLTGESGNIYTITVTKATMFIDEVADLNNILLQQDKTPTDEEKAVYYVITKDLDLTGFTGLGRYNAGGSGIHHIFVGTLDGRNHKLSNYTAIDNRALFFYIQGTVRNIEFVNATSKGRGGVLAVGILANATVENITITGKIVTDQAQIAQQHSLFTGSIGLGVKLTNIMVNCTAIEGDASNVLIFGKANANSATQVVLTNCKVVRPEALSSYKVFEGITLANGNYNYTGTVEEVFN